MAKGLEVRVVKLEDAYKFITEQLIELNQKMTGMDHVVRGNGTPGLATQMQLQDQRIKNLERARKGWKDFTVLCVSGGLVAVLTVAVQHFIR